MNGRHDSLDIRQVRNVVFYLCGIGVEILYVLALTGIGALILAVFMVLGR